MTSAMKHFLVLVTGLALIFLATAVLTLTGRHYAATICSLTQLVWMFGFLAYTVLIHSKKRWPSRSVSERLHCILTMKD